MTTPKPTPREALSHLCWALTHGENADEDIRVLSAALEQLSGNPGELEALRVEVAAMAADLAPLQPATNADEWGKRLSQIAMIRIDALRAEVAALKAKLEEEEKAFDSQTTELENAVQVLEEVHPDCAMEFRYRTYPGLHNRPEGFVMPSFTAADLAAHDDRIRRETVERILAAPTGGEKYILQSPSFGQRDILPLWFYRAAGITEPGHAGEKTK